MFDKASGLFPVTCRNSNIKIYTGKCTLANGAAPTAQLPDTGFVVTRDNEGVWSLDLDESLGVVYHMDAKLQDQLVSEHVKIALDDLGDTNDGASFTITTSTISVADDGGGADAPVATASDLPGDILTWVILAEGPSA